jgi:LPS-assembly lipoprotein
MSSDRPTSRRAFMLAALGVTLAGCVQPLYGPGLGGQGGVGARLGEIEVSAISGRFGHYLRTDLQFALGGGSISPAPKYRLDVSAAPQTRVAVVDRYLAQADSASLLVNANYVLVRLSDGAEVTKGAVAGSASFERTNQRFATVKASQDAEERAARLISELIRTRLAAAFADGSAG